MGLYCSQELQNRIVSVDACPKLGTSAGQASFMIEHTRPSGIDGSTSDFPDGK